MISTIPGFKSRLTNQLCLTTLGLIKPFITWIEIQGNKIGHAYGIGADQIFYNPVMPMALDTG